MKGREGVREKDKYKEGEGECERECDRVRE